MKIILVCSGNTCRSPMAEAIFKRKFHDKAEIISRGLYVPENIHASFNSEKAMDEMGLDIKSHISRQLTVPEAEGADLILTMTKTHKDMILSVCPGMKDKVFTLCEYAGLEGDVPDPYGSDIEEYRRCARKIESAAEAIYQKGTVPFWQVRGGDRAFIRRAVLGDTERIFEILKSTSSPWSESAIKGSIENGICLVFDNGEIKGVLLLSLAADECEVLNFAVDEKYRRRGIGEKLLFEGLRLCKERGAKTAYLDVRRSNSGAVALYEKVGFEKIGERAKYYSAPEEDALLYNKKL